MEEGWIGRIECVGWKEREFGEGEFGIRKGTGHTAACVGNSVVFCEYAGSVFGVEDEDGIYREQGHGGGHIGGLLWRKSWRGSGKWKVVWRGCILSRCSRAQWNAGEVVNRD